jgi:hypothetical protein
MKGIITHEESQAVTLAFRNKGHDFFSNDILSCSGGHPEFHYQGDAIEVLAGKINTIDFIGCHPVCQYLANSGVRWLASKKEKPGFVWSKKYQIYINNERFKKMKEAAEHFNQMLNCVKIIGKGYLENPIMHKYAIEIIQVKQTQVIQPWMFGHTSKKATCLWLFGLPKLEPSNIIPIEKRTDEIFRCAPGPNRASIRSKTFHGIAEAMANQWTEY